MLPDPPRLSPAIAAVLPHSVADKYIPVIASIRVEIAGDRHDGRRGQIPAPAA